MADVLPFAGTRFATTEEKINLADVVSPPFDAITPAIQRELHDRHPYNIVRLVLGHEAPSDDDSNNRYTRSAECYREWKARNLLVDEQRKCFYVHEETMKVPGRAEPVRRLGFIALVKLQDFRSAQIRAHEETFESIRIDRLRLLRTLQVNTCPIHVLYRDPEEEVNNVLHEIMKKKEPIEVFTDHLGNQHRIWMMHKKDPILRIHESMKPKRLIIADGHHRYETALKFRDEMRDMTGRRDGRQPYDFTMMYLQRAEDDTLFPQPVHRVLARELGADIEIDEILEDIQEYFTTSEFKLDMENPEKASAAIRDKIAPTKTIKTRFAMVLPNGRAWQLSLRKDADINEMIEEETMTEDLKRTDVVILHRFVISRGWIGNPEVELDEDDVFYRTDIQEALSLLARRKGCVAFFTNAVDKDEMLTIAENGELLPHRSTDFEPKLPCGMVLRDLNVGFG